MEPCEDWEPVERMPRALPDDTAPRLLWRYRASRDPLYQGGHADFRDYVADPVVSHDGTIWIHGPRLAHVTQLTREGEMRRWFNAGGEDENHPEINARLGPLLPLPDGRVLAAVYSVNPAERGVLNLMDPSRLFEPAELAVNGVQLRGLDPHTLLAVGPGGMVYAMAGRMLYATCRGERLMWTLRNSVVASGEGDGSFFYLVVEADGTVVVSGQMERIYRVDPATREVQASAPIEVRRDETLSLIGSSSSVVLFSVYDGTSSDLVVQAEETQLRFESARIPSLSPTGRVVFGIEGEGLLSLTPPYTDSPSAASLDNRYDSRSEWFANGDWTNSFEGVSRIAASGEVLWTVQPGEAGEDVGVERNRVLDEGGVQYNALSVVGNQIELSAIQTDGLPPANTGCFSYTCNPQHDRWIRPE